MHLDTSSTSFDIDNTSSGSNTENEKENPFLCKVRSNKLNRLIIAHLNINFLYPKFEPLKHLIELNGIDIFVISETKIDNSFSVGEFEIEGYSTPLKD